MGQSIKKDIDVVNTDTVPLAKAYDPCDNPGIEPSISRIKDTPGEMATNDTSKLENSKKQPFGKGGSGYSDEN